MKLTIEQNVRDFHAPDAFPVELCIQKQTAKTSTCVGYIRLANQKMTQYLKERIESQAKGKKS